jgi:hypothetical protein
VLEVRDRRAACLVVRVVAADPVRVGRRRRHGSVQPRSSPGSTRPHSTHLSGFACRRVSRSLPLMPQRQSARVSPAT